MKSQAVLQQGAFFLHTQAWIVGSAHPGVLASVQQSCLHVVPQPRLPTSATQTAFHFSVQQRGSPPEAAQTQS
jgi:hypothetical protein